MYLYNRTRIYNVITLKVYLVACTLERQVTNCSLENDEQIVTRSRFGRQESLWSLIVFFFYLLSSRTIYEVYVRT
jgi:type IV secretory pathway VirB9-like protein